MPIARRHSSSYPPLTPHMVAHVRFYTDNNLWVTQSGARLLNVLDIEHPEVAEDVRRKLAEAVRTREKARQ